MKEGHPNGETVEGTQPTTEEEHSHPTVRHPGRPELQQLTYADILTDEDLKEWNDYEETVRQYRADARRRTARRIGSLFH